MNHPLNNFIFFGSSSFSVTTLEELKKNGFLPKLIVTTQNKRAGRGLKEIEPEVKIWGFSQNIEVVQPNILDEKFENFLNKIDASLYVVSAYGKIMPNHILNKPLLGSFNIHPSLLPKYRGPSPLQSQIINEEKNLGVTVIKMDDKVDHGPILNIWQTEENILNFSYQTLGNKLFTEGVKILIVDLPKLQNKEISLKYQDDNQATFTKKYNKEDSLIKIDDGKKAYLKFLAFKENLGTYFNYQKEKEIIKIKINEADFTDGKFTPILITIPGKKPIKYSDFLRNEKI